jgi:hypothetical protein
LCGGCLPENLKQAQQKALLIDLAANVEKRIHPTVYLSFSPKNLAHYT